MSRKKMLILTFVMGVLATAVGLPLLSASGVPSFDVVLVALFGEGSVWAVALSLLLILPIALGVGKVVKSHT
ncbi:hypothetical protein M3193_03150 [Sporosarcina luteola]|uniref:hypothetical protein n=1 Tax=Sporosarcina luteola TaxID=582850 RepID=UPI00203BBF86|nr:hypothetical protein [Sporosarcina luteola]MCM3743129.1 hypothetical protein [Sporosarcina luteola]